MSQSDDITEKFQAMIRDPVAFCKLTGILVPHHYQEDILRACLDSKQILVNTSRQIGKTTCCAALAIWWAVTRPLLPADEGGQKDHMVTMTAPSKDHAQKLFQPMISMIKGSPFLKSLLIRDTRTQVEFSVGGFIGKIKCITAGDKGDQIRGDPNDLIVFDETGMTDINKEELIFNQAIIPSMAHTRGVLYLISTPNGRNNFFGRIALECQSGVDNDWTYIEIPCWMAAKAVIEKRGVTQLDEKYLFREKKKIGDIAFAQEYECKLIDIGISFFDWELIKACSVPIVDNISDYKLKLPESEIFFGIDVARSKDKTVIVVVERFKDVVSNEILYSYLRERMNEDELKQNQNLFKMFVRHVHVIEEPMKFFSGKGVSQEDVIKNLYNIWQPKRIYMDSTGLGVGMTEYLQKHGYPIDGIVFSQTSKKELFDLLRNLMRTGRVAFSDKNTELHNQLNGIIIGQTQVGTDVLRHATKFDDIACALALATTCTRTLGTNVTLDFTTTTFGGHSPIPMKEAYVTTTEKKSQWDW